ncbi:MAG: thioredoxin family protein [Verrucomicrobiales bacterium]|nr:thioredoxin family protein [Verrucomicrobiales bacterium]
MNKENRSVFSKWVWLSAAGLAASRALFAQEAPDPSTASPVPADPVATPIQASPVPTGKPVFAPQNGNPAPSTAMATPDLVPSPQANPVNPAMNASTPMGPTVSPMSADARLIEEERPERVQVYPDDPESAWWEINPSYAFARAQLEQKPLLLLFTGTWNNQAMALSQEVFSTKSFNDYVKENLVICYLSYKRNLTDNPDVLRRIKEKFKVRGYPNVLLFNPSGDVEQGIRGYRQGRPIDYFNRMRAVCQPILDSIEVRKKGLARHGYRDWSNYMGKEVFAKFLEHDGVRVRLQDVSGEKWLIKVNDLAPDDQRLVESFPVNSAMELDEPPEQ